MPKPGLEVIRAELENILSKHRSEPWDETKRLAFRKEWEAYLSSSGWREEDVLSSLRERLQALGICQ